MIASETNVRRLLSMVIQYGLHHNGYFPVDTPTLEKEIEVIQEKLLQRGNDTQSRINRLFGDTLETDVKSFVSLSRALAIYDEDIELALAYLDGYVQ